MACITITRGLFSAISSSPSCNYEWNRITDYKRTAATAGPVVATGIRSLLSHQNVQDVSAMQQKFSSYLGPTSTIVVFWLLTTGCAGGIDSIVTSFGYRPLLNSSVHRKIPIIFIPTSRIGTTTLTKARTRPSGLATIRESMGTKAIQ
uniref:Uncharacterized protein n=1 Tax=Candidatus Kentrum sp. SD TaxID=2126332 RepID=A0A451BS93_9GAMM|nr:MAG: hypothetical protein BECKSD772D_GA0070982_12463 [Candidatus Kentron sp. SD]